MPSVISAGTTAGTAIAIAGDTTGNLAFQTNGTTTAMTIDTSQNVGIGTTTPQQTLHINNSSSPRIKLTNATTGTGASDGSEISIFDADNSLRIINRESANILFGTADTERMRINSAGDLLINTTTTNAAFKGFRMYSEAQGSYSAMGATGTGSYDFFSFYRGTDGSMTRIGFISTSGSGTSYSTTSDYRLKENVAPMTGALAKVAQLKPVTYTWKTDGSDGQGFIAHELAEVMPDAVNGEKDAVNEDGSIKPQGVDTSFLVATLTAAIQELKAELDATKAEVAALKGA